MTTRGKFKCWRKSFQEYGGIEYQFMAVCNDGTPENDRFHKYTPNGTVAITVDNPNVVFELGKYYYLDFTEVQK